jgi:hypothetical protein
VFREFSFRKQFGKPKLSGQKKRRKGEYKVFDECACEPEIEEDRRSPSRDSHNIECEDLPHVRPAVFMEHKGQKPDICENSEAEDKLSEEKHTCI